MILFHSFENLATVAPSITRWSHPKLTLITLLGTIWSPLNLGSTCIFPIATMQTWGGSIKGQAWVPPIVPIFERQTVPFPNYFIVSFDYSERILSLSSSLWIYFRFRLFTLFIFGTTNPLGESIATLMLCSEFIVNSN